MNRREFTKLSAALAFISTYPSLLEANNKRAPALFMGHGTPLNTVLDTKFTKDWDKLSNILEKPKAILMVSAHWQSKFTTVSINEEPETIHDFGGFPDFMYDINYPAKGHKELASKLALDKNLLLDKEQGLDHGTWSVLYRLFPKANVPVFQLSLARSKNLEEHFLLAQELKQLRNKNVMIMGSGNITHNLRNSSLDRKNNTRNIVHDWAKNFDDIVTSRINDKNYKSLVNYKNYGKDALMSVPTPEHYLPLLYVLGASFKEEQASYYAEGFDPGSFSMRSVLFK